MERRREQEKINDEYDYNTLVATNLSVVAILIATVTFTAGFTLPGGLVQEGEHQGSPILKYNAAFIAFVLTDSLSFVLSTSAVLVQLLSTLLSKEDKGEIMYQLLLLRCTQLITLAMALMVIAFGTGMYAVLGVSKGFGVVTLVVVLSFFFVCFCFFEIPFESPEHSTKIRFQFRLVFRVILRTRIFGVLIPCLAIIGVYITRRP